MLSRIVYLLIGTAFLGFGCTTTETYTRTDENNQFVDVYSTNDGRSALSSPAKDPTVNGAVDKLKSEVKRRPNDVRSWLNLARLQVAQGKLVDAEASAKKALRHDIRSREAKKILAQVYLKSGKQEMAAILLDSLGGERSRDAQVLNMMALVSMIEKEPSRALSQFKMANKLDPSDVSIRMNLGVLYLKYRQMHKAAIEFERVLRVMPENTDAMLHLAIIKGTRGDRDKAEEMLEEVLARKKDNPLALFNLAVLQSQKSEYDDALDNLRTYLKTARGKSADTDQAFALIDRIKEQQERSDSSNLDDADIEALASDLETRQNKPQHAANHVDTEKMKQVKEEEREIEALEKSLIE